MFKKQEKLDLLLKKLRKLYPDAECSLNYQNPFQLLIATILSAQCTDERVNKTTPALFEKFPTPEKMSKAAPSEIERLIMSTGFYRAKAKSLLGTSKSLAENYGGEVPTSLEKLTEFPGVGRKTANVVLGNAFHKAEGVVVDTHVKRLSFRLGLSKQTDPGKVESDLNQLIPKKFWVELPHWLISHGRQICVARNPRCYICPLLEICPRNGLPKVIVRPLKRGAV